MKCAVVLLALAVIVIAFFPAVAADELPDAPSDFSAERDGARIYLSWGPPADSATVLHYNVYRGTEPGDLTFYDSVDANYTAGYDTEVVRGWTYYYAISAYTTQGEGTLSDIIAVHPPSDGYPVMVMIILLTVVAGTLIFAYWKGRDGA